MKTVIWKGLFYNSLECCKIKKRRNFFFVESKILGIFENKIYLMEYDLKINSDWSISNFALKYEVNNTRNVIEGNKEKNAWIINDKIAKELLSVDFIDISLSPFTNSLPINNLHLKIGEERIIDVIYINILESEIKLVKQKYKRKGEKVFTYENVPNDFEADIEIDNFGLVNYYPKLFQKVTEKSYS